MADLWFAPKRFESKALSEHLGVLLVKQYAPTGGDFINRHFGLTIVHLDGIVDSLIRFERMTRVWEAIHVIAFFGFLAFSLWRAITLITSWLDFAFAIVVYLSLILSPALLQRYNRLRVDATIRCMAAKQQARGRTGVPMAEMRIEVGPSSRALRNYLQSLRQKERHMQNNLIAKASIRINVPRNQVWKALVDPSAIRQYMFGTHVVSDWQVGSSIVWKGEWQGKSYEDKGTILQLKLERFLQYSHFSPLSGMPDVPENYHTVTIELSPDRDRTGVTLTQDRNASEEERAHSEENWRMMLAGLKKFLEG